MLRFAPCLALLLASQLAAQPSPPRRQVVEDLRLDAESEDFPGIFRLAIGRRGQIAVFIRQDQSVRLYDSTGAKVAAFGRKGAGPGESRMVNHMAWKADTLWLYDNALKRLTFISAAGKLIRHEALPPSMNLGAAPDAGGDATGAMYLFSPVAIRPDGKILGHADLGIGRDEKGKVKTEAVLLVASPDGTDRKRVGKPYKGQPTQVTVRDADDRPFTAGAPFLTFPGMDYSTDGTRFGVVWQTLGERTGTYTVVVVRTTGDTVFARTYPFAGTRIPAAVRDSAINAIATRRTSSGAALYPARIGAQLRDLLEPMTPKIYPRVEEMALGRDDLTWVLLRPSSAGNEAVALNARGDPVMSIVLPKNSRLVDGGLSTIWAIETDDDGLQSVVRYRIR